MVSAATLHFCRECKLRCSRHQINAMLSKLVFPLKILHVPEECVSGGTRVVAGSGLNGYVCATKAPSRNLGRTRRVRSWRHTSGGRFRVKRVRVCHKGTLPKPGSGSFSLRVFLAVHQISGFNGTTGIVGLHADPRLPALRAVVR
jgi:hypothetical protein